MHNTETSNKLDKQFFLLTGLNIHLAALFKKEPHAAETLATSVCEWGILASFVPEGENIPFFDPPPPPHVECCPIFSLIGGSSHFL
jgi:hypothetical protein